MIKKIIILIMILLLFYSNYKYIRLMMLPVKKQSKEPYSFALLSALLIGGLMIEMYIL